MAELHWRDLAAASVALTFVAGCVIWWLRATLASSFAGKGEVETLSADVRALKEQVSKAPTHEDIRSLSERVQRLESATGVLGARVEAVHEGIKRIEHDLRILLTHHLDQER